MLTGARCAKRLRLARHSPIASPSVSRFLHASHPRPVVLALPAFDASQGPSSLATNPWRRAQAQKFEDLDLALRHEPPSYGRIWACYVELVHFVGLPHIPQEVHQRVLRGCSPTLEQSRAQHAQRITEGRNPFVPHPHESRFKAVVQNMRQAGFVPELEDYHYILSQFAAYGYHIGALRVLKEISYVGLAPTATSFDICLQAVCYHITFPCRLKQRDRILVEAVAICNELTRQMQEAQVRVDVSTTNLVYRILNKTLHMETLDRLLKAAYGVDLGFPDRPPLEFWQGGISNPAGLSVPMQFTTSALNTTIEVLGRLGNISKLVQAFEVLTTPLPSRTASVPSSSFEDDEDDDFGVNNPGVASFSLPYAKPNTFTFESLLRHISQSSHHVFARHYLLHVLALDKQARLELREACSDSSLPRDRIFAPTVTVTRNMLLSVYSLAARQSKMELLQCVRRKMGKAIRWKHRDIRFYTAVRERWSAADEAQVGGTVQSNHSSEPGSPLEQSHSLTQVDSEFVPSQPSNVVLEDTPAQATPEPQDYTSIPQGKPFDVDLHLAILRKSLADLLVLDRRVRDVLGRTAQRRKERLGRRIWRGQKVYMRHAGRLVFVDPRRWHALVNFKQTRNVKDPSVISSAPTVQSLEQKKGLDGEFFTSTSPPST